MEFRKMLMITLYAEQKKRHRCIEQSFRLCVRVIFIFKPCHFQKGLSFSNSYQSWAGESQRREWEPL